MHAGSLKDIQGETVAREGRAEPHNDDTTTPPDSGYAWLVMVAGILVFIMTFGTINSFGVLQAYFLQTLFASEPAREIAWISTMAVACSFGGGVLATPLIARYGLRRTSFIGTGVATLGLLLASFSTKIWHFVLTQGVIFGMGGALNLNVYLVMPSLWFEKRRSLAIGIIVAGTALGSLMLTPMLNSILNNLGAAWVYRIMTILYFALTGFSGIVCKPRISVTSRQSSYDFSQLKNPTVLLLCIAGFFTSSGYMVHILYFPPSVVALGKTRTQATNIVMVFSVFSAIGRVGSGQLAPYLGPVNILIISYSITSAIMLTMWNLGHSYITYFIFYSLNGIFSVPFFVLGPVIIAKYFPKEVSSLINGLSYLAMGLSLIITIPVSGLVFDVFGKRTDYSPVIYITSGCYLISIVFFILLWVVLKKREPPNHSWRI